jgi:hypothetical protein
MEYFIPTYREVPMRKIPVIIATTIAISAYAIPAFAADTASTTTKLVATATSANETKTKGLSLGSATGTFTIDTSKGTVCYYLKSTDLQGISVGSHIHSGVAGFDGGVVIPLKAFRFNAKGRTCQKVNTELLKDIIAKPSAYYFNVHTRKYPAGAVRGQLELAK